MSMTATRSTRGMMHTSLNFGGAHADGVCDERHRTGLCSFHQRSKLDNRRVLAALVDVGIVLAGSVVILFAADALSGDSSGIRGALLAVILGWALYYHFAMESGGGQTVGKKLMKLRVVLADGRPAGMREIAVRTVVRVVDSIGFYIVGLIVMLATGERRQRLGDLAAGTKVVDASATAYAPPAPVAVPVEETVVEDEAVEDEPADLAAPEAPVAPEMRPFDPPMAEDEPVEDAEPVEDERPSRRSRTRRVAPVEDEPVARSRTTWSSRSRTRSHRSRTSPSHRSRTRSSSRSSFSRSRTSPLCRSRWLRRSRTSRLPCSRSSRTSRTTSSRTSRCRRSRSIEGRRARRGRASGGLHAVAGGARA